MVAPADLSGNVVYDGKTGEEKCFVVHERFRSLKIRLLFAISLI